MTIDLEERLYRELPGLADRATGTTDPVLDLGAVTTRVGQRRRRRTAARIAGVTCSALLVVGFLFVQRSGQGHRPAGPSAPGAPFAGIEEPLVVVSGTKSAPPPGVERPGGQGSLLLADGQTITVRALAMAGAGDYAEMTCVGVNDTGVCSSSAGALHEPDIGGTATIAYWTNVPAKAIRVEFRSAVGVRWQRPVGGFAVFTVASHAPSDVFVAYDAAGVELARVDWSTTMFGTAMSSDVTGTHIEDFFVTAHRQGADVSPAYTSLTDEQVREFELYADDTMRACLAAGGDAAWTSCVQSTDIAVKAYAQALRDEAATSTSTTAA